MDAEMIDPLDADDELVDTDSTASEAAGTVQAPVSPGVFDATGETEAEAAAVVEHDIEALIVEHDIEALIAERDQYKDIALRLQADFENYRKRSLAQQELEVGRATGKVAEALLPVLDACEAAFSHGADGVEPIWSALIGALQRQGLEAMDLQDKAFDPADADAVAHEPGDGEPTVIEVMRTGYRWNGRVLRAAMVKVRG